jgi:hypothetical protein
MKCAGENIGLYSFILMEIGPFLGREEILDI